MDLIGSLTDKSNVRGITLNSQNIDLFNIIEQAQSRKEAVQRVYEIVRYSMIVVKKEVTCLL